MTTHMNRLRRLLSQPAPRRRARGFTLIELLVVMAILALLIGLVGPNVMKQFGGAKTKTAATQISEIDKALEIFRLDTGRYPSTAEGLQALVAQPGAVSGWNGPYLKGGLPNDPWGNAYQYMNPGIRGEIDVLSFGADGQAGGEGKNADIGSWD